MVITGLPTAFAGSPPGIDRTWATVEDAVFKVFDAAVILAEVTEFDDRLDQLISLDLDGDPQSCPYLPGRVIRVDGLHFRYLASEAYQSLLDQGFRRSGRMVYRPCCPNCRECRSLRVPVAAFQPSRSQRRTLRRNTDLRTVIGPPKFEPRKVDLYDRYLQNVHNGILSGTSDELRRFLYDSPTDTLEMSYWLDDRLVGVGIVDRTPRALSSVYFYYDPAERRRRLGIFSALREIEECRRQGLAFWYAGFYVRDCAKMSYKAGFRPFELLALDGTWSKMPDGLPSSGK